MASSSDPKKEKVLATAVEKLGNPPELDGTGNSLLDAWKSANHLRDLLEEIYDEAFNAGLSQGILESIKPETE